MHIMSTVLKAMRHITLIVMLIVGFGLNAQVTTSSLSGQVTEGQGGEPLIGASVVDRKSVV